MGGQWAVGGGKVGAQFGLVGVVVGFGVGLFFFFFAVGADDADGCGFYFGGDFFGV